VQLLLCFWRLRFATTGIASLAAWGLFALIALHTLIIFVFQHNLTNTNSFTCRSTSTMRTRIRWSSRKACLAGAKLWCHSKTSSLSMLTRTGMTFTLTCGMSGLPLVTAASGPMAHIDGVAREDADKLARLLGERVTNQEGASARANPLGESKRASFNSVAR